jgi:hypothetical protein
MDSNVVKKVEKKYVCEKCDYITSKKTDYAKHCMTAKHNWMENVYQKVDNVFCFETCGHERVRSIRSNVRDLVFWGWVCLEIGLSP